MALNRKWTAVITAILTILTVLGGGKLTDTVDIKIGEETEECTCPEITCPGIICQERNCPEYSMAYVNNCVTGQTDKYICNEKGECKSTIEILSELG